MLIKYKFHLLIYISQKVEGYLQKLGEKGIIKHWKTRWFVLDQNILSYYHERADPSPISFILLQAVRIIIIIIIWFYFNFIFN